MMVQRHSHNNKYYW